MVGCLFIGARPGREGTGGGHSAATQSVPVYPGRRRANFRRTSSGTNLPATKWWRPEKRPAQRLGAPSDTSTSGRRPSSESPPVSASQPEGGGEGGEIGSWGGCTPSEESPSFCFLTVSLDQTCLPKELSLHPQTSLFPSLEMFSRPLWPEPSYFSAPPPTLLPNLIQPLPSGCILSTCCPFLVGPMPLLASV